MSPITASLPWVHLDGTDAEQGGIFGEELAGVYVRAVDVLALLNSTQDLEGALLEVLAAGQAA